MKRSREDGTNGLGLPVEMSQMRNTLLNVLVTRLKEFGRTEVPHQCAAVAQVLKWGLWKKA